MRRSHEAVMTERAKPSQTRTIDAARTATYSSVACTAWPPGAQTAPATWPAAYSSAVRSEEHTSELQSRGHLVCRLLLEKKKKITTKHKIIILNNPDIHCD